jgi:5'-nucleotidase
MLILTNDDGIDAPGIVALKQALGDRQTVTVAPKHHHSGCSHRVTAYHPIAVEKRSDFAYAVDGTPADCSRLGVVQFCPEVQWVLSGVNEGGNLGTDVYISGTVAAVREATILGVKGIAISQFTKRPRPIDWAIASDWTAKVLAKLWDLPLPNGHFWNVNLPHLADDEPEPEMIFCPVSQDPLQIVYREENGIYHYAGEYEQRDRRPGTDVDVCFSGNIAISQISL